MEPKPLDFLKSSGAPAICESSGAYGLSVLELVDVIRPLGAA